MIRRPPRSTLDRSSAASDVYKRQLLDDTFTKADLVIDTKMIGTGKVKITLLKDGTALQSTEGVLDGETQFVPVSYTHLRAHETVLDLVCCLLLEKKKKITYTLPPISQSHKQRIIHI